MTKKLIILISIAFTLLFAYFSGPYKLGVTPDSVSYIQIVKSILLGNGIVDENGILITHWPPLYPLLVALTTKLFNCSILTGAFILNVGLLSTISLIFYNLLTTLKIDKKVIPFIVILLLTSYTSLVFIYFLSEGLFMVLLLLVTLLFIKWVKTNSYKYLIWAGVISSALLLTRYAGFGYIVGFGFYILIFHKSKIKPRLKAVLIYTISSLSLFILWLIYCYYFNNSNTIRNIDFFGFRFRRLLSLTKTIIYWFLYNGYIATIILSFMVISFFKFKTIQKIIIAQVKSCTPIILLLVTLLCSYTVFIVLSISFFDENVPVNTRIFFPFYFIILTLVVLILNPILKPKQYQPITIVFFIILLLSNILNTYQLRVNHYQNGTQYSAEVWKNSQSINYIKSKDTLNLYTNAHDIMRFYKNVNNHKLPFVNTKTYDSALQKMTQDIKQGKAQILFFDNINRRYFISKPDLLTHFKDFKIHYFKDGMLIKN
ncbi:glycosyltransferase family 39 protein [Olleya sp. UBA1516]|uniref:glycosyltransferase family 39 protein n=1 Tax=Olleya sp. UBA1516 TaxID=1947013 RepID=UPI0025D769EA|nr:glycosyltransferase family 39 protein [Olleya sp. UBA1516]|tara:strand:+ start:2996 stop:4453 length:1458 start_codon:yes stop_codon:yes gene_type:complete